MSFWARSLRCPESAATWSNNRAVGTNDVKAGDKNREQSSAEKQIHLPLHAIINLANLPGYLLVAFVVLNKQARHRGAKRLLPRLQRQPNLLSSLLVIAIAGQRKSAVHRVPELRKRSRQILLLVRRTSGTTKLFFDRIASSRSAWIRSNCAVQAVSGYGSSLSSMSRMAKASEFRSFCTRSNCSETLRLRSTRLFCRMRNPAI